MPYFGEPVGRVKSNSVEIVYISYKNLRYTFDQSAKKIDGRIFLPSPHVKACDILGFVEYFFLKLSTTTFPLRCTGQASTPMNEENCFVSEGNRVTRLVLLADWAEKYFSAQSAERNSTTSGTGLVRISSQGLFSN